MPRVEFEADGKHLQIIALTLFETASRLLIELAKIKGPGPWLDEIKTDLERETKNTVFTATMALDEPAAVEAALGAIKIVFDRIKFTGKPQAT